MVRQLYGSADGLLPCFECWAADGMHVPGDDDPGDHRPRDRRAASGRRARRGHGDRLQPVPAAAAVLQRRPGDARATSRAACGRTAQRFRFMGRIDEARKVRGMFVYPEQIAEAVERDGDAAGVARRRRARLKGPRPAAGGGRGHARRGDARAASPNACEAWCGFAPEVVAVPAGAVGEDAGRLVDRRRARRGLRRRARGRRVPRGASGTGSRRTTPARTPRDPEAGVRLPPRVAAQRCSTPAGPRRRGRRSGAGATPRSASSSSTRRSSRSRVGAAPIVNAIGVWNIGPTLLEHGTEDQQAPVAARDALGGRDLVPGLQRAGRGERPRRAARRARSATATPTSSPGRRCGPRTPTAPTGASCCAGPIPSRRRSTRA